MAAKDGDKIRLTAEIADLWFHCLVLLERMRPGPGRRAGRARAARRHVRPRGESVALTRSMAVARLSGRGNSATLTTMDNCIFCKIVRGEIPSEKVYEDDEILAFHDIRSAGAGAFHADTEEAHRDSLADATAEDAGVLGRMLALSGRLAREQGSPDGYRTIVNTGRIGRQDVMHLHVHVIGGPKPLGPNAVQIGRVKEKHHGIGLSIWHWMIVLAGRRADFRHQEAAQHRPGSRRRGQGLQGRHEGRTPPAPTQRRRRKPPRRNRSAADHRGRGQEGEGVARPSSHSSRREPRRTRASRAYARSVRVRCSTSHSAKSSSSPSSR